MEPAVKILLIVALVVAVICAITAGTIMLFATTFRDGFSAIADDNGGRLNRYADV